MLIFKGPLNKSVPKGSFSERIVYMDRRRKIGKDLKLNDFFKIIKLKSLKSIHRIFVKRESSPTIYPRAFPQF